MLDEVEYAAVSQLHTECVKAVKQYRKDNGTALAETPLDELYKPVMDLIVQFTGTSEFDMYEVLRRHRIARWE
jgi:hypothetical protein